MLSTKTSISTLITLSTLLSVGSLAQAATISVSGAVTQNATGSVGPLGIGQTRVQSVHLDDGQDFLVGNLEVANRLVGGQQQLSVRFLDLRVGTNNTNTARTFTMSIDQDFVVSNQLIGNQAEAKQTFNATSNMIREGQRWSAQAQAFHEGVEIPRLSFNTPVSSNANGWANGWRDVDLGTTNQQHVTVSGVYRIRTVYTFTVQSNPACDWMAIEFNPDNPYHDGLDRLGSSAHLAIVPLPPAAWAGIGGLGVVGIAARIRRRKLEAAEVAE
jgi:hypothetical protein